MSTAHSIQRGKRYRRLIMGVFAVGILGLLGGMLVDQNLAGLVVYAVAVGAGLLATLYVQVGTDVPMYDERERRVSEQASYAVINVVAYVGLPTFIGLLLLDAAGHYAMGPMVQGLFYGFSGLGILWGVTYLAVRARS